MTSKRSHEGLLLVDHSAGPGLPGQPRGVVECPTFTCRHCQLVVVMNPQRTRTRAYCPGCDHYICDTCEPIRLAAGCRTMNQVIEQFQNAIVLRGGT